MGKLLPVPTASLSDYRWHPCSHWSKPLCPFSLPQSQQPEGWLGLRLHDCTSYRLVVSGFPKTAAPTYVSPRIYQCPLDADRVSSWVNSDILFPGVRQISSWGSWFPFNITNGDHDFIHCIPTVWKVYEEERQWNWAEGKGKPKWPIRVVLNWAKAAEADILPGSVLGSVAPVQAALQLGPPLLPWRCIWEAFSRVLPQGRLEEPWWELRPVLLWPLASCDTSEKSFPSQSPSSYQVSGAEIQPLVTCVQRSAVHRGFCAPHLTIPLQANSQAAPYFLGQCGSCVVWGPACVHQLPVTGSWQGKYRAGEGCSETLEQHGTVVLCVIKLIN